LGRRCGRCDHQEQCGEPVRDTHLEEPYKTRCVRSHGTCRFHHPFIACDLTLSLDLPQNPDAHRMEYEKAAREASEQIRPIIAAIQVSEFMKNDVVQVGSTQTVEHGRR
jgi:hypothetical protein